MYEDVKRRYDKLKHDAEAGGYVLNSDETFVMGLVEGMLRNDERYGMESCPCRLFIGKWEENLDIVCPCVYRDDDLAEYGACYCAMYVTSGHAPGLPEAQIPERRQPYAVRKNAVPREIKKSGTLPYPVWRCSVCGYLCARKQAPEVCPVCKANKDRFELFMA